MFLCWHLLGRIHNRHFAYQSGLQFVSFMALYINEYITSWWQISSSNNRYYAARRCLAKYFAFSISNFLSYLNPWCKSHLRIICSRVTRFLLVWPPDSWAIPNYRLPTHKVPGSSVLLGSTSAFLTKWVILFLISLYPPRTLSTRLQGIHYTDTIGRFLNENLGSVK